MRRTPEHQYDVTAYTTYVLVVREARFLDLLEEYAVLRLDLFEDVRLYPDGIDTH